MHARFSPCRSLPRAELRIRSLGVCGMWLAVVLYAASDSTGDLRGWVSCGNLPDLRWPDFSDFQPDVKTFYEASEYSPVWSRAGKLTHQAEILIAVLSDAGEKGLDADDYDASRWVQRVATLKTAGTPDNLARFDLALTVSLMRYASDLNVGRLNSGLYCPGFNIGQERCEMGELVRRLAGAEDPCVLLAALEPSFPGFQRTLKALDRYVAMAREDDGELLPATKKPVEPGTDYAGVPRLARLLRRLGDFPANAPAPAKYEGSLVDAVKRFQARHGLDPDGRLGKSTLVELNTPLAQRVRQLQLTLERWRWVPREFPRPPLIVNLPEFELHALNDSFATELEMKIVVGKAYGHQTPVFAAEMNEVIFRPYWNVPASITRAELLPKIVKDPSYLVKNGYEVVTKRDEVVTREDVNDEILSQIRAGTLSIRQIPGPKNSLGLVKFLFPNQHDVYLHDTPATELFSRSRRDFSHGCMRVEKPVELAQWVLRGQNEWTVEKIRAAMSGTAPLSVILARPIPVLIVYATAVVRDTGDVRFFDDIYGQDAALEALLAQGFPRRSWPPTTGAHVPRRRE